MGGAVGKVLGGLGAAGSLAWTYRMMLTLVSEYSLSRIGVPLLPFASDLSAEESAQVGGLNCCG